MDAWIPTVALSALLQQAERTTGLERSEPTTSVALVVLVACALIALIAAVASGAAALYRKHSHRDAAYHRHSWV